MKGSWSMASSVRLSVNQCLLARPELACTPYQLSHLSLYWFKVTWTSWKLLEPIKKLVLVCGWFYFTYFIFWINPTHLKLIQIDLWKWPKHPETLTSLFYLSFLPHFCFIYLLSIIIKTWSNNLSNIWLVMQQYRKRSRSANRTSNEISSSIVDFFNSSYNFFIVCLLKYIYFGSKFSLAGLYM